MILTDRDVFVGGHLKLEVKERFKLAAHKRDKSMSLLLSKVIEEWLDKNEPDLELHPSKEQDVPLPFEDA
jgi:hypothetical protein